MEVRRFDELSLPAPLLRAVDDEGYVTPTPIQSAAIPYLLEGRDLLGCAQTGTGKTAAFALPILTHLARRGRPAPGAPRALILTPTRELAIQIDDSFSVYGRHVRVPHTVIYGGVKQHRQVAALQKGVDVLTATPGRLLDLMNQGHVRLGAVEHFVLDEADRMLDMGFLHDVRRVIAALPERRQTLLFSATMPDDIAALSRRILDDPVRVAVTPVASTVDKVRQRVLMVEKKEKQELLTDVLQDPQVERALVFTRTKHGANRVVKNLVRDDVSAEAIHGNKSQTARQRALENFRAGRTPVLVATDIAARGIDVEGITHVINFDLPNIPESYVHRIGRTARAGADGMAISFCEVEERPYLRDIEKLIRQRVPIVRGHPWESPIPYAEPGPLAAPPARSGPPSRGQQRRPRGRGPGADGGPNRRSGAAGGRW